MRHDCELVAAAIALRPDGYAIIPRPSIASARASVVAEQRSYSLSLRGSRVSTDTSPAAGLKMPASSGRDPRCRSSSWA